MFKSLQNQIPAENSIQEVGGFTYSYSHFAISTLKSAVFSTIPLRIYSVLSSVDSIL